MSDKLQRIRKLIDSVPEECLGLFSLRIKAILDEPSKGDCPRCDRPEKECRCANLRGKMFRGDTDSSALETELEIMRRVNEAYKKGLNEGLKRICCCYRRLDDRDDHAEWCAAKDKPKGDTWSDATTYSLTHYMSSGEECTCGEKGYETVFCRKHAINKIGLDPKHRPKEEKTYCQRCQNEHAGKECDQEEKPLPSERIREKYKESFDKWARNEEGGETDFRFKAVLDFLDEELG